MSNKQPETRNKQPETDCVTSVSKPAANAAEPAAPAAAVARQLLVFARPPVLGRVKTRLAATLGPAQALRVYRRLLALTQQAVAAAALPATVWLAEAPAAEALTTDAVPELPEWPGLPWHLQTPAHDLGGRLAEAFAGAFAAGATQAAVIGTDCPGLTAAHLTQAFDELAAHDLVLGPAADGGYYLLALRQPQPALFQSIAWSSPTVLAETLAHAATLGLRVHLLPVLSDVDTEEDLTDWPELLYG